MAAVTEVVFVLVVRPCSRPGERSGDVRGGTDYYFIFSPHVRAQLFNCKVTGYPHVITPGS